MKKILQIVILTSLSLSLKAQTATSIANGNWTNPLTWNCTCVPINSYSVTINNSVTLNTSMVFNTGGITISNTGSLVQDASLNRDIWINGGYFNNNGKSNFRYLLVSAGSITNPGSFTVSAFTNSVNFNNTGSIKMDSMYVAGNFTNSATAQIIGDSLTNTSSFVNSGKINITWSTNTGILTNNNFYTGYAHTNAGVFFNNDSLILTGSIWNKSKFYNNTPGKVRLTKNFHNYTPGNTAAYVNNGNVTVLDSWYNTDTVRGTASGYFQVADTSANSGVMGGNFTFCDLTPPPTFPKIDLNSGPISLGIVFCVSGGVNENELAEVNIYPNPSNGILHFKNQNNTNLKFTITDVTGKTLLNLKLSNGVSDLNLEYPNGVYFLKITDLQNGNSKTEKLIIQK